MTIPQFKQNQENWPHLTNLILADPDFATPGKVNVIIGADNFSSVIQQGMKKGDASTPLAQRTIFGWVLSGPVSTTSSNSSTKRTHCCVTDFDLKDLIAKFWSLEEVSSNSNGVRNKEEEMCEQHFSTTHSRDTTGRYIVRLPLKADPQLLGNSKEKALSCLKRMSYRFQKDPNYLSLYTNFLDEYKSLGHMLPIDKSEENIIPHYYLPHHGVLRKESLTTKLRVVFNGSAPTTSNLSLNDLLYTGEKLQKNILEILLWIRTHRVLFSSDIVKMFRQIQVHNRDRNLQRIYWRDLNGQLCSYQLTTVTYGLSCAPFLALRTLDQLILDEGNKFPLAILPMTTGRYVDDIFGGAESREEAKLIISQLIQLCDAGGFPLQKWRSNFPEILPEQKEKISAIMEPEPSQQKILGLLWNSATDNFGFSVKPPETQSYTKRLIASDIARLYDPLGLTAPVIIKAKIMLQEIWCLKISWDDPLPEGLLKRWLGFRTQLLELNNLTVPRWIDGIRKNSSFELHGFADASKHAMAAVVFARITTNDGKTISRMINAKTKVAPIKRLSIPRLELTAALLLIRLLILDIKALNIPQPAVFCWSDSTNALAWINSPPSQCPSEYVRNRAATIQELLPNCSWNFVPGKENPADCATRGIKADQLSSNELWWQGPTWLIKDKSCWPKGKAKINQDIHIKESSKNVFFSSVVTHTYWNILTRYSSFLKLIRVVATCSRFVKKLLGRPGISLTHHPLTPKELEQSRKIVIRNIQKTGFANEIQYLSKYKSLPNSSPLLKLTPFIDGDGLLRVGGRLDNAAIDEESKHPLIIPKDSPITPLIITEAHIRTLHGGTQLTLGYLRTKYWIMNGRPTVRSHILKCIRCARYRATRAEQLMGKLPTPRVSIARPFTNTGLDYAGPITLKTLRGRAARHYKAYIAIFVCMATSAVHIELVTDYSSNAFIAAFKRFTGRRGLCATLQSDCGTNFVGANAELRRLFDSASSELKEIATLLSNDGTEWKFNPPGAPHFGGKWEAAVKSVKFHLKRVLGEIILTYEEMSTVLTQIESVLNTRPLCPITEDITDLAVLTPGHFLIGGSLAIIPEPDLTTEPTSRLSHWQILRQLLDHFWTRWSTECLQRYQAKSKWHHPSNTVKVGSMVLIVDERYPPGKWPLARVTQLHPGADGFTRVVSLKTAFSEYKRPVAKVCILPMDSTENFQQNHLLKAGGKC
ncbi:uncharacterized protein [Cardiocondyla obscurior]|uniref:uncharacterized protein n=1 Tax=Cardiocondyla obscurior TaxID=286306 RepID=UPI0039656D36